MLPKLSLDDEAITAAVVICDPAEAPEKTK
jgi:hypothetical protein